MKYLIVIDLANPEHGRDLPKPDPERIVAVKSTIESALDFCAEYQSDDTVKRIQILRKADHYKLE